MSHQLPQDLHTFLNALQGSVGRVPINVSYNDSEPFVTDYFITVGHQRFQLWCNHKSTDELKWGYKSLGISGFGNFQQGFDMNQFDEVV